MYLVSEQKIKSVNIFHDPLGKSCKWWAYSFSLQRAHWGAETVAEVSGKDVNTTHKKNTALTILGPLFRIYTFSVFRVIILFINSSFISTANKCKFLDNLKNQFDSSGAFEKYVNDAYWSETQYLIISNIRSSG